MEKIDFIKWWSESTLAVRYNALLAVGVIGSFSLNIYQHKEIKSNAKFYQRSVDKLTKQHDSIVDVERLRFDNTIISCRLELKECNEEKYKQALDDSKKFKEFLYEQKKIDNQ